MKNNIGERMSNLKGGNADPLHPYYLPLRAISEAVRLLDNNHKEAQNNGRNTTTHKTDTV